MRGHVGNREIILWFKPDENFTEENWDRLLNELKSHPMPHLYPEGKRLHSTFESSSGMNRVIIYLTDRTVTPQDARAMLHKWNIDLVDDYGVAV